MHEQLSSGVKMKERKVINPLISDNGIVPFKVP